MIIAGLMAGTSADALDIALVEFREDGDGGGDELTMRLLASREVPFDEQLGADILRLLTPGDVPLSLVSSVDARLGRASAAALGELCAATGVAADLVVSHGQTVRHDVDAGAVTATLQLGRPAWIAEHTGAPVLSDVRSRDVAAGGQGAPLASMMDQLLLAGAETPTALLNLGGIANITVVAPDRDPIAFDTGPANALIDLLARRLTDDEQACDRDGALAERGTTDPGLLEDLLADPYYRRDAPKTTGKELFHADYLDEHLRRHPGVGELDVIATLTELTARTVADACRQHGIGEVIASGGGTRNPTLMSALQAQLGPGVALRTTDEALGLPEGAKEAGLMALLGWLSWHGLPSTLPSATGATHGTIGGSLTAGSGPLRLPAPRTHPPARLRIVRDEAASPTTMSKET